MKQRMYDVHVQVGPEGEAKQIAESLPFDHAVQFSRHLAFNAGFSETLLSQHDVDGDTYWTVYPLVGCDTQSTPCYFVVESGSWIQEERILH